MVNVKVVPPPGAESSQISPPCLSMIFCIAQDLCRYHCILRGVQSLEYDEDALKVFLTDANAIVSNLDLPLARQFFY